MNIFTIATTHKPFIYIIPNANLIHLTTTFGQKIHAAMQVACLTLTATLHSLTTLFNVCKSTVIREVCYFHAHWYLAST